MAVNNSLYENVFEYEIDLENVNIEELNDTVQTSRTYKVDNGRIIGNVDGLNAVRQAVEKLLMTERFAFVIYSGEYGSEIDRLVGKDKLFVEADIERTVTDAVLSDDRVESIQDFQYEIEDDTMTIKFNVITLEGIFSMSEEVKIA